MSIDRRQLLLDTFITACEGGVNYWLDIDRYHWHAPDGSDDLDGFFATGRDVDEGTVLRLDAAGLTRAFLAFLGEDAPRVNPEIRGWIVNAWLDNEAGDIDATAADVLAQVAMLGEVVYG